MAKDSARSTSRLPNITAQHLNQRLSSTGGIGGSFWKLLVNSMQKSLPVSAASGQIGDHLQEFFCKMISRDAFAKRLTAGEKISDKDIVVFAIRSGYTDIRKWGIEPITRTLYGAKTERERENLAKHPVGEITATTRHRTLNPQLVYNQSPENSQKLWDELIDENSSLTAQATEEHLRFKQTWARLERVLAKKNGRHRDKFIGVARKRFLDGETVPEIVLSEGLPPVVTTGMLTDIRATLRKSAHLWTDI